MHWSRRSLIALALFTAASSAFAKQPGLDELVEQLKRGTDFRVRVQAALQLGKSLTREASKPLEDAFVPSVTDIEAAVRATLD